MIDTGLWAQDRAMLHERYGFLEFVDCSRGHAAGAQLMQLRHQIHGWYWLHLGQGWRFFAPENLITRLTAVLDAETHVFQVGINLADAATLTGTSAPETNGTSNPRRRPLPAHRRNSKRPSDVRNRTTESDRRCGWHHHCRLTSRCLFDLVFFVGVLDVGRGSHRLVGFQRRTQGATDHCQGGSQPS
jgi:hypothetical protein